MIISGRGGRKDFVLVLGISLHQVSRFIYSLFSHLISAYLRQPRNVPIRHRLDPIIAINNPVLPTAGQFLGAGVLVLVLAYPSAGVGVGLFFLGVLAVLCLLVPWLVG